MSVDRIRFVLVGLAVLLLLVGCQPIAAPEAVQPAEPEVTLDHAVMESIEAYVAQTMRDNAITGLGLGIVQDGELVYAKGFGVADVDSGAPVTPRTVFQMAEVSMTPTAMAVMQLAEAGLIDLDDPVTDYLPYFEMQGEGADTITVRQILEETSGIPDSGDRVVDWSDFTPALDDEAVERLVRSLADRSVLFVPGTGWEFSDIAYMVLGDLVAKVAGQPFEAYMQDNILVPLGMEESTYLLEEVDSNLLASPHAWGAGGPVVADAFPYSRQFAASNNLFSNTEDMAKLVEVSLNKGGLGDTQLLSAEAYDHMWEPLHNSLYGGPFSEWGMGWWISDLDGHPTLMMGGADMGFESAIMLLPEDDLGVIFLSNGPNAGQYYSPWAVQDVIRILFEASG